MNDDNSTEEDRQAALLALVSTLLEETLHSNDYQTNGEDTSLEKIKESPITQTHWSISGAPDLWDLYKVEVYGNPIEGFDLEEKIESARKVI